MRPMHTAVFLVGLGVLTVIAGIFGQFGLWYGLIATGAIIVASALTLINVDNQAKKEESTP